MRSVMAASSSFPDHVCLWKNERVVWGSDAVVGYVEVGCHNGQEKVSGHEGMWHAYYKQGVQ